MFIKHLVYTFMSMLTKEKKNTEFLVLLTSQPQPHCMHPRLEVFQSILWCTSPQNPTPAPKPIQISWNSKRSRLFLPIMPI